MNFTQENSQTLLSIMRSRRDVRGNSFTSQKIEEEKLQRILEAAKTAPSVGYSQPWDFVLIDDMDIKKKIHKNFEIENAKAKHTFKHKKQYKDLKLEGILEAPLNIAVLYTPNIDPILGMTSMNKMGEYSVVCAVQNMWLMARSLGIGMGWVSILNEKDVLRVLNVPNKMQLVAYLCLGYVNEFSPEPELKTMKWEEEKELSKLLHKNTYRPSSH